MKTKNKKYEKVLRDYLKDGETSTWTGEGSLITAISVEKVNDLLIKQRKLYAKKLKISIKGK